MLGPQCSGGVRRRFKWSGDVRRRTCHDGSVAGHDDPYDRPLVEPDNMFTGGFQTGRFHAGPDAMSGRSAARWSLGFAVLWIGGVGSLVAVALSVLALSSGDVGVGHRRVAAAGLVLGIVGLAAAVLLFPLA